MSEEIELKLSLAPNRASLLEALPVLATAKHEQFPLINRYFDTPDHRLSQAGIALRLRYQKSQWLQTLKTRGQAGDGLHQRQEWEMPVSGEALEWGRLPQAVFPEGFDRTEVKLMFETNFVRHAWQVTQPDAVIEVALDQGRVLSGSREVPLCEVELELKKGAAGALFDLAEVLAAAVPLSLSDVSKAERGFALITGEHLMTELADSVADGLQLIRQSRTAWLAQEAAKS